MLFQPPCKLYVIILRTLNSLKCSRFKSFRLELLRMQFSGIKRSNIVCFTFLSLGILNYLHVFENDPSKKKIMCSHI